MIVYQIQHHGIFHLRHIMSEKQSLELSNATEYFITVILIDQGIASHAILRIFDKNPGNVAVGKLLVKCYLQQDKYKEALDIFDALSDKLGDNPSLLLSKIDCLRSTYLYSEALKVAYELDYKYPNNRMYMLSCASLRCPLHHSMIPSKKSSSL